MIVHEPDGRLLRTTLPVVTTHVGCVMVPTDGAVGVGGWVFTVALAETTEVHPNEFVTE